MTRQRVRPPILCLKVQIMTMLVSITRVSHIPEGAELEEFHKAHKEVFEDSVGKMKFLRDPQDANQAGNQGDAAA